MEAMNWMRSSQALKLLITDNVNNGNRLIKRLNRKGEAVSGLTVTTSVRIAKELLIHYLAAEGRMRRIREVTDDIGAFILEGILRAHPEQYSFVPQASLCTATAVEILSNLNMIRENQMTDAWMESGDLKIEQLKHLIREYEDRLQELGFYDRSMLLQSGLKILVENNALRAAESVGLLYTNKISVLEKEFLRAYAPEAVRLSLEKPEKAPVWHFYKSYGIWNEAEYILEDMRTKQIPFGQVRIVYTSQDYELSLQAAFGERKVPVRFTGGRLISGKDSIRMLLSLIKWASEGYRYEDLKSVVMNPLFAIPVRDAGQIDGTGQAEEAGQAEAAGQAEGNGQKTVNALKEFLKGIDDRIGWGLDRYKKFILEAEQTGKFVHTAEYLAFLGDAVGIFDAVRLPVDAAALFGSMIAFVRKYSRSNEDCRVVLPLLEKERRELAFMLPLESLAETLDLLKDRLENMSAGEAEDPSAVEACRISGVELLDRPYIYVIGLADRHYGTALIESPVLNDLEREKYFDFASGNVTLSRDRAGRRLQNYEASLELSEAAEIHLGFCCFDTVMQETLSPSSLFLDLREKYGAEIKDLPVVEYPGVIAENTIVDSEAVWERDGEGQAADTQEAGENTGNTGNAGRKISASPEGSGNPDAPASPGNVNERCLFFSPSSLDTLLACPAKYNYRKIRRIPEEDYAIPDSGVWLNPGEKGTYFHLILQEYIGQRFVGRDRISPEMDMDLFEKIFRSATEKTLERVPVESPAVARQEQEEVRDAAVRYLTDLHREFSDPECPWHVLACEMPFGREGKAGLQQDYDFLPTPDPDLFDLFVDRGDAADPDSSGDLEPAEAPDLFHITFNGIIDRLDGYTDQKGTKHFRIVDYKTGSFDSFKKNKLESRKQHPTTQHTIYRMYVGQSGSVDVFEYHFPFEEDDGNRKIEIREFGDLMHDEEDYVLRCLHDSFVLGYFPPSPKTGGCTYCKYSDICLTKIEKPEV